MPNDTFKLRKFICQPCVSKFTDWRWASQPNPPCPTCGQTASLDLDYLLGVAPAVHGDEIDIEIRHGICNPDGTPRRFRSKSEIRQAAAEKGLVILGETPNPSARLLEARQAEKEKTKP